MSYSRAVSRKDLSAAQRAFTASRASLLRASGDVFLARAWPPRRPLATAAGSFLRLEVCLVDWATTSAAECSGRSPCWAPGSPLLDWEAHPLYVDASRVLQTVNSRNKEVRLPLDKNASGSPRAEVALPVPTGSCRQIDCAESEDERPDFGSKSNRLTIWIDLGIVSPEAAFSEFVSKSV